MSHKYRLSPSIIVNNEVEINGQLEPGMIVVVEGNERLFPGQPVRVLEEESPA